MPLPVKVNTCAMVHPVDVYVRLAMDTADGLDKLVQHSQPLKLVIGYCELTTPSASALGDACTTSDISLAISF